MAVPQRAARPPEPEQDITALLDNAVAGKSGAADELLDAVYHVLHRIAESQARREDRGSDPEPTALVNEAFIKVLGGKEIAFENRRHMYGVFAMAMREVLVDAARRRGTLKRRHVRENVPLSAIASPAPKEFRDVLSLDAAFSQLEQLDGRASEVARLKCFAGLTDAQIADVTGLSERTVQREWSFARAFLRRAVAKEPSGG